MTRDEPWAVILAGGDGWRLRSLTETIVGRSRPKQFCPIVDDETLLDRTRRRVDLLVRFDRQVVVVTRAHEPHYRYLDREMAPGRLVVQPENRGTGPGIVYPLLRIRDLAGDDAPVAIFPCDHYVFDDCAFMGCVARACESLEAVPDAIILLGVEPMYAETEYGWIEPVAVPVRMDDEILWRIRRFWEKPSAALAEHLLARRCLWNTFVMVARVRRFLDLVRSTCPGLLTAFRKVRAGLDEGGEQVAIEEAYRTLPSLSFASSVLARRPSKLAVIRVTGLEWSDWGSVGRVLDSLRRAGRRPSWVPRAEALRTA